MKIRAIQKGSGEGAIWYRVSDKYPSIREELKPIRWGSGSGYEMVVYRVYDTAGNIAAEIESASSLLIVYMHE